MSTLGTIIYVVVGLSFTAVLWIALFARKESK
jgi:uncharacterized membrane protein YuzA (DUF378 family)